MSQSTHVWISACAACILGTAWGVPAAGVAGEALPPGLVRHYTFGTGNATQSDLTGTPAEIRYKPDNHPTPVTEPGRTAGSAAVLLDGASFEAQALLLPTNAFTVAVWTRPIAMGTKTGNDGRANGMIVSSGSGYYDGWRLLVHDQTTWRPSVELGRAEGAFGVQANDALNVGFWNHVATTWDGVRVRLYLNGMLSTEMPYAGPAVAPKSELRVGYTGFGVGSLKMAVGELAIYDRALSPEAVAAWSLDGGSPAAWRAWSRLADARRLPASSRTVVDACAALLGDADTPVHLRGQAVGLLARAVGADAEVPSRVLVQILNAREVVGTERQAFSLALADAHARERDPDAAARVLEALLANDAETPLAAAATRLRLALTLQQGKRHAAAREEYRRLRDDLRLPASARATAALGLAQTWRLERKLDEARAAFEAIATMPDVVPHLKAEALARAAQCANLAAGRPARDAESHRQRLLPLPEPALSFFVAPQGHDNNPGTLQQPFASLERARDAIRSRKAGGPLPAGGATVYLRGGRYTTTNTFVLTDLDSGRSGAPVVYRAWQDERPVLDGGFRVRNLIKVTDPAIVARLPPEARGNVYAADMRSQGYGSFEAQRAYGAGIDSQTVRELYQDGRPLPVARWPNTTTLTVGEVRDPATYAFVCRTNRLARWTQATDLMAAGYWMHLWADCTVPVAAVNPAAGTLRLQERPGYGLAEGRPFHVLNLLEEIDRPGEWYLDRATGQLYVWPLGSPPFDSLVLTRLGQPFFEARGMREVVFQGLAFEYGRQHGIVMDRCVNAVVAGCVIRRLGGTGLIATRSEGLQVYGNVLDTLGHTGMRIDGGDRRTLTSGRVTVENNDVGLFGRCTRTYTPALLLDGCGARVAHNHFHDAPSSAMRIEGNDHLIEYNQVDHVVQESDDQGALDMWGNPSYRGVIIRYNRWQDIGGSETPCGQAGVRLDDAISGVIITGNRFERASAGNFGGVQIHGGQFNIVDGNLFVGGPYGVTFSPWGLTRWNAYLASEEIRSKLHDEVDITHPPYSARYPELADLETVADLNRVWRNVFVGTAQALPRPPQGSDLWDNRVFAGKPDAETLAAQSALGTLPPEDEIGPYDDPRRASKQDLP